MSAPSTNLEPGRRRGPGRKLVGAGYVLSGLSLVLGLLASLPAIVIGIVVAARGRVRAGFTIIGIAFLMQAILFTIVKVVFDARAFRVPSVSMVPTVKVGDRVVITRQHHPGRGDIVVFHPPAGAVDERCGAPPPKGSPCARPTPGSSNIDFIKRVVGLPGDRLAIKGGHAIVNGRRLSEPYAPVGSDCQPCDFPRAIIVPRDEYYMLGDNRGESVDSREFGPVKRSYLQGQVRFRYLPFGRIGSP